MKKTSYLIFICFLIPLFISFTPVKEKPLKVALTKSSPNYVHWINKGDSTIVAVDLFNLKPADALVQLHDCAGLILTGGGDIDPALYQNAGNKEQCKDIDRDRDILEWAVINEALSNKMPILGICRGEQMLNVAMGGSLISDIPSYIKIKNLEKRGTIDGSMTGMEQAIIPDLGPVKKDSSNVIHQCDDYLHCYHTVWLERSSLLRSIIGADTGFVTTNHHQAVLNIGKGLKINARSGDGLTEGIEWNDATGRSFMVGVQWHPERMDTSNAFSGKLLQRFIAEVQKHASKMENLK